MVSYIDFHCDTLERAGRLGERQIYYLPEAMLDLERLRRSGCEAQFFAIFMTPQPAAPDCDDDGYIDALERLFRDSAGEILAPARCLEDLERNQANGKISGFLTLEDGRAVRGSMERLERFFARGIRLITLTWNYENCFGSPNSFDRSVMERGLTAFGKDAVRRMNELGMLVDVSHLSDGGFRDVAQIASRPFVASHSNCRALNPHPRSMTDEMIRTLADHGGIMGVNFEPSFLTRDLKARCSRTADVVRHLRHMIDVGGVECAAIGTDLDGIGGDIELGSVDRLPKLFDALERAGFTGREIEHIARKNARRVLAELKP